MNQAQMKDKMNNLPATQQENTLTVAVQNSKNAIMMAANNDSQFVNLFMQSVLTEIQTNPKLLECTPDSFMGAMLQSAQLRLIPNRQLGTAYLIPYKNKKPDGSYATEVQFQVGYRGLKDLFYRDATALKIEAHTVHANDFIEIEYGLEPKLIHKPLIIDRGESIAWYAIAVMKDTSMFIIMNKDDVDHVAHKSKTWYNGQFTSGSPWLNDYDEMAKKTVVKRLAKLLPMSLDMQRMFSADETTKHWDGKGNPDMLDEADDTNWDNGLDPEKEIKTEEPNPIPPKQEQAKPTPPKQPEPKPQETKPETKPEIVQEQETAADDLSDLSKTADELIEKIRVSGGYETMAKASADRDKVAKWVLKKDKDSINGFIANLKNKLDVLTAKAQSPATPKEPEKVQDPEQVKEPEKKEPSQSDIEIMSNLEKELKYWKANLPDDVQEKIMADILPLFESNDMEGINVKLDEIRKEYYPNPATLPMLEKACSDAGIVIDNTKYPKPYTKTMLKEIRSEYDLF